MPTIEDRALSLSARIIELLREYDVRREHFSDPVEREHVERARNEEIYRICRREMDSDS